jgi:hypothetical protein
MAAIIEEAPRPVERRRVRRQVRARTIDVRRLTKETAA